ncbi:hypothetical protein ACJ65_06865, partial [Kocuria rhizophila]
MRGGLLTGARQRGQQLLLGLPHVGKHPQTMVGRAQRGISGHEDHVRGPLPGRRAVSARGLVARDVRCVTPVAPRAVLLGHGPLVVRYPQGCRRRVAGILRRVQ